MILFFENGRFGNQLFQYVGLKKYFPNGELVFFGCEELQQYMDNVDVRFIRKGMLWRSMPLWLIQRIVWFLVSARVLGKITEKKHTKRFDLFIRKGLFWKIFVAQNVFFQHRDIMEHINDPPVLKPYLQEKAIGWLHAKGLNPEGDPLVFVHIRRGDYLHWPSREFPAVLDLEWYKRAMGLIRQKIGSPIFVLLSDDRFYVKDVFEESNDLVISDNEPEVDLAIMALCRSGVLSPSSFAWWGAFYARAGREDNLHFMAPKYWVGHRAKKWKGANAHTEWINYIE